MLRIEISSEVCFVARYSIYVTVWVWRHTVEISIVAHIAILYLLYVRRRKMVICVNSFGGELDYSIPVVLTDIHYIRSTVVRCGSNRSGAEAQFTAVATRYTTTE